MGRIIAADAACAVRKRGGGEPKIDCDRKVKKWLENWAFLRGRRSEFLRRSAW
jgi:hypothetical protein